MKNTKYYIHTISAALVLCILVLACKKDVNTELSLSRSFAPNTITTVNGETSVTISWPISLFTTAGQATYAIEVSKDLTFTEIATTKTTTDLSVVITDNDLVIKKDYYARIKTMGLNGAADSNWTVSSVFRITGEQFLNPVTSTNVIDVGVQLTWRLSPDLTKITITPATGAPFDVALNSTDLAAGLKVISGLTQITNYSAEIFANTKSKGTTAFKTKASFTGNIVDISATTGDPAALTSAIASSPSGSVIVCRRGEKYTLSSVVTLSKSVTIVTKQDFGTNYAQLRSSSSFTFSASLVDSVVFRDFIIRGAVFTPANPAAATDSYNAHYLFNVSGAGSVGFNVGLLRFDNCIVKQLRGFLRSQVATGNVTNYFVNNCVIDSLREYGMATTASAVTFKNIKITNSTIYRTRRFINHPVAGNLTINIENSTINEVVAGANPIANYIIDFNTFAPGSTTILNTIFGKTWDETGVPVMLAGGYRAPSGIPNCSNSFGTSDLIQSSNSIGGLTGYGGASTALFTDPSHGNFLIKDVGFTSKNSSGDPRWRIN